MSSTSSSASSTSSTSSSVRNNSHDLSLLETAYQIGRFIQSFFTEKLGDGSGKPCSHYSERFHEGPNPYYSQTKEGLVLEGYYGTPSKIHTPYGLCHVLGSCAGNSEDFDRIMEAIKEPLGLELIKEGKLTDIGRIGPYWAITKWGKLKIEKPIYKEESDYIPYDKAKEVWKEFVADKEGLSLKVLKSE